MFRKRHVDSSADALRCSFCNKFQEDVAKLIAGPAVFICDQCVQICNDIIAEDRKFEANAAARERGAPAEAQVEDNMTPNDGDHVPGVAGAIRCSLCRVPVPLDEVTWIPERGALCPGCIGEIEAAIAEKRRETD